MIKYTQISIFFLLFFICLFSFAQTNKHKEQEALKQTNNTKEQFDITLDILPILGDSSTNYLFVIKNNEPDTLKVSPPFIGNNRLVFLDSLKQKITGCNVWINTTEDYRVIILPKTTKTWELSSYKHGAILDGRGAKRRTKAGTVILRWEIPIFWLNNKPYEHLLTSPDLYVYRKAPKPIERFGFPPQK